MSEAPLKQKIAAKIAMGGPLTIEQYMAICLSDPDHGYYATGAPIGAKGDFITAPEVSQLFGEMIGIWVIDIWNKMGRPEAFVLVEAGPGRGTLMADMLRTINQLAPQLFATLNVVLIEIGQHLQKNQAETLAQYGDKINWIASLDALQATHFALVANEFLDALPIRQFISDEKGAWAERGVGLDTKGELQWVTLASRTPPHLPNASGEGQIFQINEPAQAFIEKLAKYLNTQSGAALFIDYGHLQSGFGDTLQAMKDHKYVDVLSAPGGCDLTAHVDFAPLIEIAKQQGLSAPATTQGQFLLRMGLLERAGQLGANQPPAFQEKLQTDVERLAAPDKMGDLFKVLALTSKGITPHGF